MVRLQFIDPGSMVPDEPSVPRQDLVHFQGRRFIKAGQVPFQGILTVGPALDVGGDVIQDMVAGNEDLSVGLMEADVPQGVAGSSDAAETIPTAFYGIPVIQKA